MKNKNKIILISYYSSIDSSVMSEWVKDKLFALNKLNYHSILITSTINPKMAYENVKQIRLPSMAPTIFFNELKSNFNSNWIIHLIFFPLVITFGSIIELTERMLLKRLGHGVFSWTFSVIAYFILNLWRLRPKLIFSSGGPVSAHISNIICGVMTMTPRIVELQDPLFGIDIGHNKTSSRYLLILEKFLVKYSYRVIYVTKNAAYESKLRYPNKSNIQFTYTSSVNYEIKKYSLNYGSTFRIIHLGNIYSTRNFNNVSISIDNIINKIDNPVIDLTNLGNVSEDLLSFKEKSKFDFYFKKSISRIDALKEASKYDLLLLIQHTDDRSLLTIPYKTWDYLNLKIPILALTNNPELDRILQNHGHVTAKNSDVNSIELALKKILENYTLLSKDIKKNKYNIVEQTKKMIQL